MNFAIQIFSVFALGLFAWSRLLLGLNKQYAHIDALICTLICVRICFYYYFVYISEKSLAHVY